MKKRYTFFTLILLIAAMLNVCAAEGNVEPVRWRTIVKTTGENSGTVTFKALVAPGWHLYGLTMPEGGPVATSFDFKGSTGLKFTGELKPSRKAAEVEDPLFGMTLNWWDSNVEFTVPFKLNGKEAPMIKCKITFMACDGTTCRPPKTEDIATKVTLKK